MRDLAKEMERQASEAGAAGDPYHHGASVSDTGPRLLKRREVEAITGLSKSHLYDLMKRGLFPLPVRISTKAVGWVSHEVHAWVAARIAVRDGAANGKGDR